MMRSAAVWFHRTPWSRRPAPPGAGFGELQQQRQRNGGEPCDQQHRPHRGLHHQHGQTSQRRQPGRLPIRDPGGAPAAQYRAGRARRRPRRPKRPRAAATPSPTAPTTARQRRTRGPATTSRFVCVSSGGVRPDDRGLPLWFRLSIPLFLHDLYQNMGEMERIVRSAASTGRWYEPPTSSTGRRAATSAWPMAPTSQAAGGSAAPTSPTSWSSSSRPTAGDAPAPTLAY